MIRTKRTMNIHRVLRLGTGKMIIIWHVKFYVKIKHFFCFTSSHFRWPYYVDFLFVYIFLVGYPVARYSANLISGPSLYWNLPCTTCALVFNFFTPSLLFNFLFFLHFNLDHWWIIGIHRLAMLLNYLHSLKLLS